MSGRVAFNLLLLVIAAYFLWSAFGYEASARRIPLLIGTLVFVLQGWVTVKEAFSAAWSPPPEQGEAAPPPTEARRVLVVSGWMMMFFALLAVLGTLPAIFLFILLFLVLRRDVGWRPALVVSVGMSVLIWLLFVRLMNFELYPGVLFGGTLPPI